MLLAPVLRFDGHDLIADQLAVTSEGLSEAYFVGESHDSYFIIGLQMIEHLDGRRANLLIESIDAPRAIYQQDDRERKSLLTEIGDRLLNTIFKDGEVIL